jgi:hypothetical protein
MMKSVEGRRKGRTEEEGGVWLAWCVEIPRQQNLEEKKQLSPPATRWGPHLPRWGPSASAIAPLELPPAPACWLCLLVFAHLPPHPLSHGGAAYKSCPPSFLQRLV